jgi:pimeloyl-ACP methyl ester carboxylesterase
MSKRARRLAVMAGFLAVFAALVAPGWRRVQAARLLLASLEPKGPAGAFAFDLDRVTRTPETISLRAGGALRSLRYSREPAGTAPRLMLLHGVHPLGIDEPRLQRLARAFAASGLEVHTPELPQLLSLEVDPRVVEQIASCADALRAQRAERKLGAFGVSFTGGLLLMAAASPTGARSLAFVVAVGAHHDLRRVALHFAGDTARGPDGERAGAASDPYGARVLIAAYAPAFFSAPDVPIAREALRAYLGERYGEARKAAAQLSRDGAARYAAVIEPHGSGLASLLRKLAEGQEASLAALSPAGHLRGLRVPVMLLHGRADPIVPSTESAWLAREVPPAQLERLLITPALRHAEAGAAPSLREQIALIDFVAAILADRR